MENPKKFIKEMNYFDRQDGTTVHIHDIFQFEYYRDRNRLGCIVMDIQNKPNKKYRAAVQESSFLYNILLKL